MPHSQRGLNRKNKKFVYERAKNRCEHCSSKLRLEIHHIVTRGRGVSWPYLNDPVNLVVLCNCCHRMVHDTAEKEYKRWLRLIPTEECTQCGGEWEIRSSDREILCIDCEFIWPF